jgi:hypothetical protein
MQNLIGYLRRSSTPGGYANQYGCGQIEAAEGAAWHRSYVEMLEGSQQQTKRRGRPPKPKQIEVPEVESND